MKAIVQSCRPVLGHIPLCGCVFSLVEMESTKQGMAFFNVLLDKDDLIKAGIKKSVSGSVCIHTRNDLMKALA